MASVLPQAVDVREPSLESTLSTSNEACPSAAGAALQGLVWSPGAHIPQLDGARGLAILIVTLYRFAKEFPTDTTIGWILAQGFQLGDRGVDLFFVLSGFLITGILVDTRHATNYFRNFLARRSLRIFPLYFLAVALSLTIGSWLQPAAFSAAKENQFYLWTYTANLKMSWEGNWCFGSLDHFWSLAVEEHFYLVWPAIIWWFQPGTAKRLTLALAVVCGASRMVFAAFSDNGVAPDVATIFRCDALLMGAFLALHLREPGGKAQLKRWAPAIVSVSLLLGLGIALSGRRLWTINHSLWPLLWLGLLSLLLTGTQASPLSRFFALSALRKLGKYSYAMYVFQNPLIPLVALLGAGRLPVALGQPWMEHLLYMLLMFVLTYAIAVLSWYGFESHFLRLKPPHAVRPELITT